MKMPVNLFKGLGVALFSFLFTTASAQETISISDGGLVDEVSCASSVILTDSNVDDGNYGPNESFIITLCTEAGGGSPGEFIISPDLFGDTWDVDEESQLFIYDGNSIAGDLLGAFNTTTHPAGVTVTGTGICLTIEFISGENSSGAGFTGTFTCVQPLQPFDFSFSTFPESIEFDDLEDPAIPICFTDSIVISTLTNYPLSDAGGNGYTQSDESSFFSYTMGDGTIYTGEGLTEITHTYQDPFGYLVTVTIVDTLGQVETRELFVLIAPKPTFSNLVVEDSLCIGEETVITGGVEDGDLVGVSPSTSAILGGGILGEQLYLPDGNNENYETSITIDDFPPGLEITSINDFVNFCVTMEHSYLGDLEMMLTCPNGTSINIFNANTGDGLFPGGFGGAGTYLGQPLDNENQEAVPGIGYSYCFFDDAELGELGEEFNTNTVAVTEPSAGTSVAPGTYLPEESFSNFIGCPVNGDWTLTVRDNITQDDGFIFNWSIFFDPLIDPNTVYFSPDVVEVFWNENDDIVSSDGASITVQPSQPGNNSFVFNAIDEFGCEHDTVINVYIRPEVNIENSLACDLTHIMDADNAPAGGEFVTLEGPGVLDYTYLAPDAVDILASEYGIYEVEFTDENCAYKDTAEIDFRPNPQIQPFFGDTVLCGGASIIYDAGPQQPNSGNFIISWTQDGAQYNDTDYSTSVNSSGEIVLTITGVCADSSFSSTVTAIEVDFQGDTICDLIPRFRSVDVEPESIGGAWSANYTREDGSNVFPNEFDIATEILPPDEFGDYLITYTDVRCPTDAVTRNFKWYEQPDLTILPTNPIICYETDSLNLTAVLQGAGNNSYFWELSTLTGGGAPPVDFDLDQNQNFPPESFDPEVNYIATVESFDEFGRCPEPGRDTLIFKPIACLYDVPNVITPNGDGLNDLFVINNVEDFPNASLAIFNRWGQEVFSSTSYDQYQALNGGWDPGDNAGGVYFIELKLPSIDVIESGNLTIITEQGSEQ
ncbi:MAG: gliding motility-associated C-terminal domain-containing protein [Cryomorphaceae bacterium]